MPPKKVKDSRQSSPRSFGELVSNGLTAVAKKISPRNKDEVDYDSDNELESESVVSRDEIPIALRRSSTSSGQSGSLGPSPRSPGKTPPASPSGKSSATIPVSPSSPLRRKSSTTASSPMLSSSPTSKLAEENELPESFMLISAEKIPVRVSPPLPSNSSDDGIKSIPEVSELSLKQPLSPRFIDETIPKFFLSFDTFKECIEAYRPKSSFGSFRMFSLILESLAPGMTLASELKKRCKEQYYVAVMPYYQQCVETLKNLFDKHINFVIVLNCIIHSEEDYRLLSEYFEAAVKSIFDVSSLKVNCNLFETTFNQFEQQSPILQGLLFSSQNNPMGLSEECLMQARRRLQLLRFYEVDFNPSSRLTYLLTSLRGQLKLQNLFSSYELNLEILGITLAQKIYTDYRYHHDLAAIKAQRPILDYISLSDVISDKTLFNQVLTALSLHTSVENFYLNITETYVPKIREILVDAELDKAKRIADVLSEPLNDNHDSKSKSLHTVEV